VVVGGVVTDSVACVLVAVGNGTVSGRRNRLSGNHSDPKAGDV